jgi:hypothetical protein
MTWCKRVRDVVVAGWCVSNEQRFGYGVLRTCRPRPPRKRQNPGGAYTQFMLKYVV